MASDFPFSDCFVCGGPPDGPENPSIEEEFYPGTWCHLLCMNSPEGMAWRERQKQSDPRYARYLTLISIGARRECPTCQTICRVSAKARGMGAGSWEACCTQCSNITDLNGYAHPSDYDAVMETERMMLFGDENDGWRDRMTEIAKRADGNLTKARCRCGGAFSIAAAPRCPKCRTVLMDSFFHYAFLSG